jgi:hypothetical protein
LGLFEHHPARVADIDLHLALSLVNTRRIRLPTTLPSQRFPPKNFLTVAQWSAVDEVRRDERQRDGSVTVTAGPPTPSAASTYAPSAKVNICTDGTPGSTSQQCPMPPPA